MTCSESLHRFITENPTPPFGYKQPWLTGLGHFTLIPTQVAIGLWNAVDTTAPCCTRVAYRVLSLFLNLLLLPITLLGMAIKGLGEILPKHHYKDEELTDEALKIWRMPAEEAHIIYSQLERFTKFCKDHEISVFIDGGTRLGALRHHGIIPWDNDADLGIAKADLEQLENKRSALEAAGLTLQRAPEGTYHKIGIKGQTSYVDLFTFDWLTTDEGEKRWTYSTSDFRALWPRCYFREDDFKDPSNPQATSLIDFGPDDHQIQVPQLNLNDHQKTIERWYGDDCMIRGVLSHTHIEICGWMCPCFNFTKCRFKITDFAPAPWV